VPPARIPAVISSRLWGVYDVADEGYLVRRGHVICSMSPTQPETNLLVVAVFRFCVSCVNAVKLHVNDADVLVTQGIRERASDNRRSARATRSSADGPATVQIRAICASPTHPLGSPTLCRADERVACTFGCTGVRPMTGVRGYFGGAGRAGGSAGPDELAFCWRRECSAGFILMW